MSTYLDWGHKQISGNDPIEAAILYDQGYLFTRKFKGDMYRSRSVRIVLADFYLSSENKRVLKKTEGLSVSSLQLPLSSYDWKIHKMGKDFYQNKFQDISFSAAKIRSLINDPEASNFNVLFQYSMADTILGYAISYDNPTLIHYAYPFYDYLNYSNNFGMAMMLKAILFAQEANKQYVYIGSLSRARDVYKLQFKGLQWFDGETWKNDIDEAKKIIKE